MKPWVYLSLLLGHLAAAQVVTPFDIRYQTNERGAITLIANTLTCVRAGATCDTSIMNDPNKSDNNRVTIFVNADPMAPTWPSGRGGSSSATLNLPSGSEVLFAGLYWGARADQDADGRNQIYIKPPGSSTYQPLTAYF